MTQRGGGAAAWTVVGAVLLVPALALAAWAALLTIPDPTAAGEPATPVIAAVTDAERTPSVMVALTVATVDGQQATVAVSGTVTRAPHVGDVLENGAVVATVNDRPVRAMVAAAPLWRVAARGDKGEDVRRLGEFLVAAGYLQGEVGDTFNARMATAVRAFNRDAGLPTGTATFDPATVVWVGSAPLTVARVDAPVGTVVGPGSPLATGPAVTTSVTVAEPGGGLEEFGEQATLVVGDVSVPYAVGSGSVTAAQDVAALATALGLSGSGTGEVRSTQPEQVRVIPASALVTGAGGSVCVYADAGSAPVVVTSVGGGASSVQLDASFTLDHVLANPGEVPLAVSCGS